MDVLAGREGRGVTGCRAVPFTSSFAKHACTVCTFPRCFFELSFHFPTFSLLDCSQPASRVHRRTKALLMRSKLLDSLWWFVLVLEGCV